MNTIIQLLQNKEIQSEVHKKILSLFQDWGTRFESDRDILPLFSEIYNALKKKGVEFPPMAASNNNFGPPA
jgi:hypothetical protein